MDLALVLNPDKPGTLGVLSRMRAVLVGRRRDRLRLWAPTADVLRRRADYAGEVDGLDLVEDVRAADAVVACGGDGTLLHAVRLLQDADRPLLGINLGNLGFLTDTPQDQLENALLCLLDGRYRVDARMRLEARLERRDGSASALLGLNDAVVHGHGARVLDVSIGAGGIELGRTLADGIIVATPSGSTAYNLSAGGPVVSPRLYALVVTPISPHTLSMRSLVAGGDEAIEIVLHRTTADRAELTVDGQTTLELAEGDRVVVRRASRDLALVVTRDRNFYDTLRTKLGWGHRGRAG